ncbi:MAG: tetratricopeptide repeat protein [Thermoplasmata archaeon]
MAESAEDYIKKGNDAFNAGEYDTALEYFNKAAKIDPTNSKAWSGKGKAILKSAKLSLDYEHANEFFDKAIKLDPENKEALKYKEELKKKRRLARMQSSDSSSDIDDEGTTIPTAIGFLTMVLGLIVFIIGFLMVVSVSAGPSSSILSFIPQEEQIKYSSWTAYAGILLFMIGTMLEIRKD